jgi:hypothetical protein
VRGRQPLPPALGQRLTVRVTVAAAVAVLATVAALTTVAGGRASRAFEERAERVTGTVADRSGLPSDGFHVPVEYVAAGAVRQAQAPSRDPGAYDPGDRVELRVDPDDPLHVQPVAEPYDVATPLSFAVGCALLALAAAAVSWWRVRRVVRLAARPGPQWSFEGSIVDEVRRLAPDRTWLVLRALDDPDGRPVAAVPLLRDGLGAVRGRCSVVVRGDVRDRGTVVAAAADCVLWPSGPARSGRLPAALEPRH